METRLKNRERQARSGGDSVSLKARACINCARLKIKCRWPEDGAERPEACCTRCARMKLACHIPVASQRRKRGKSTRVAQLEQKIDGIVSLLAAHKHIQENGAYPVAAENMNHMPHQPSSAQIGDGLMETCVTGVPPAQHEARAMAVFEMFPGFRLSSEEALAYLDIYRRDFTPNYPFVIIPPDVDAHTLHSQSPGLFWVIMAAVAPQSVAVQQDVRKWVRQHIAEHMIVKQGKSLLLLQTILLHLAWGDYHFYVYSDATNFLQLAIALVIDLRLDRSPESSSLNAQSPLGEAWAAMKRGWPNRLGLPHTSAEKRAVLGFFHFSSIVSSFFRRAPQLPWNQYLSQCCESLAVAGEHESDHFLVALVKMQHIADKVYGIMPITGTVEKDLSVYGAPVDMAVSSVRAELDSFANAQPSTTSRNNVFRACYYAQAMRLYEPVISMRAPPVSSSDAFSTVPVQRTAALWTCLQSAADCFSALLAIPATQLPSLPLTATGLLAFAVVTTSRLLLLEPSADWDPELARQKLDFASALQRIADWFEQGDRWAKDMGRRRRLKDDKESILCHYTARLRWIRQWYISKTTQGQASLPLSEALDDSAQTVAANPWPDVAVNLDFWPEFVPWQDPSLLAPTAMQWPIVD